MKKWRNPELIILGIEKTEMETFKPGTGGGGNGHAPDDCFCRDSSGNGHDHGAPGQSKWCECCQRDYIPDNSLPGLEKPVPS